jgi:hypothetical protein
VRIDPDTKDALLFAVGILGIVAQGVLYAFGVPPSIPLIGAYLTMSGVATVSSMYGGSSERRDDDDESPRPRRKRKGTNADRRDSDDS